MDIRVEQVRDEVIGLKPVYSDAGNCTEIMLINGKLGFDRRGIKSVLAAFARAYALDLSAQRDLLRTKIKKKIGMPFCIGPERVFIPLKMRQVLTTNDLAYGYVNVKYVPEEIMEKGKSCCMIVLATGMELEIFNSKATILQNKNYGLQMLEFIKEKDQHKAKQQAILDSAHTVGQLLANISELLERIDRKLGKE